VQPNERRRIAAASDRINAVLADAGYTDAGYNFSLLALAQTAFARRILALRPYLPLRLNQRPSELFTDDSKRRVACYIDVFYLYHAIDDLRKPHLKWLHFCARGFIAPIQRAPR
jgi:hypothetical protein